MTREELRKKLSEIIHKKHPVPVYLIGGALGELQGCNAYEEETIREGMWRTKYLGVSYWFKGITDNEIIDKTTITKRAFREIVKLWPLRMDKILNSFWSIYTCEGGLQSKELKHNEFCPVCQEIIRVGKKLIKDKTTKSTAYPYYTFRKLDLIFCFAMFLQFSTSYRARFQDIFGMLNKDNFIKSPIKELWRLRKIVLKREHAIKNRLNLLFWMIILGVILKRKIIKEFISELDIERVKLDEADFYFCLRRSSYDFGGYQLATRLEIADKIDKEQGNLILGI